MKVQSYIKKGLGIMCMAAVMLMSSCTGNFEKYNKHPYDPTEDDLTQSAKFGALIQQMMYMMHTTQENENQLIEQFIGNQYGGYMSTINLWSGTNFSTFNPQLNWIEYPYSTVFTNFYSAYFKSIQITEGTGYLHAWANIVRVAVMLKMVDTYGPIPYSHMNGGDFYVAYDSVEEVYKNMIEDLDNATEVLTLFWNENSGTQLNIASYDIAYNGNFGRWIKFANSLKLRMAVRMSKADPVYASQVAQRAVEGGLFTDNSDNLYLPTNDNPYAKAANNWNELRISADLQTHLTGYNDPRASVYMSETVGLSQTYLGVRLGVNADGSMSTYEPYSKPLFEADSPVMVMNAAEVAFLMAEVALDKDGAFGLSVGDPQTWYETGVSLSLQQHGGNASEIATYLQNTSNPANYANGPTGTAHNARNLVCPQWNAGDSDDVKLQKIITQKWIANFSIGFEAWCDFRRTGYPVLFPTMSNLSNGEVDNDLMVRRIPYPQSEYDQNGANVAAAVQLLGGPDNMSTDLWWAR
ncbi:MAG: SusD/RagB family nutrient-binding outer membrane lipoprotein [Rikenellaceae bacterium]|nr:SusD/RagB family nutrient-binding outer membrane lipoprotein [Rikenellaceae bacterium]